jgi:hypothetical protein
LAGEALLRCIQSYDRNCSGEKSLRLELEADDPFLLAMVTILTTGLELVWENRKNKKTTTLFSIRSKLEAAISLRRKSSSKRIREAGNIMENMINNFLI